MVRRKAIKQENKYVNFFSNAAASWTLLLSAVWRPLVYALQTELNMLLKRAPHFKV